MKTKIKWRIFTIADYKNEEKWLRRMHAQGWKFVSFDGRFHFEECQPEDVIYKLEDCSLGNEERESCVQLFTDYGWEYISKCNHFSYFRKLAEKIQQEEEGELYNPTSEILMMQRVSRRLCLILLSLICTSHLFVSRLFHHSFGREPLFDFFSILIMVFYLYVVWTFVHFLVQYLRLKQDFSKS